mgnify:FL=1
MRICKSVVVVGLVSSLTLGLGAVPAFAVTQADVDSAAARLSELGGQLSDIQSQLQSATDDVVNTSRDLSAKQSEVEQTHGDLEVKKNELSEIMRSNYKQGSASTLDFILGSTSIDDLVSRVTYMDKVSKQRADVIASVKSLEEQLEQEEAELEDKQEQQSTKVELLQTQASEYDSRVSEAMSYYNSLDSALQQQVAEAAIEQNNSAVSTAVQAAKDANDRASESQNAGQQAPSEQESKDQANHDTENVPEPTTPSNKIDSTLGSSSSSGSGSSIGGGGVSTALAQIGKPYVYGATGPNSFDCSGLVCYSYGYARGRTTGAMISSLQASGDWKTDISQLSYGDLIFTDYGHVGIYLGGGTMVHAPRPGYSVCTTNVWSFIGGGSY